MKIRTHSLITPLCAAIASLVIIGSPARAGYIATLTQVGPNVVANGSGAIDLTGLSFLFQNSDFAVIVPDSGTILTGPTASTTEDHYSGITGPLSFGSGGFNEPTGQGSGSLVGIVLTGNPALDLTGVLGVPVGYTSNTFLSESSNTYMNATFSSLGVTPGTYEWTWGTGANQNFTLKIGATTVPDAGSTFMLLSSAIVALGSFRRHRI